MRFKLTHQLSEMYEIGEQTTNVITIISPSRLTCLNAMNIHVKIYIEILICAAIV